jgi:uncharacterized membrane protein
MNEERPQPGAKPRPRIETLSDLIFGLALSIGALTLIGQPPADFKAILLSLSFFSFSFLVLVSVWRSYSTILSVLPVETERLVSLNILLLFTVSIEPYLFNELFAVGGGLWDNVSMIYAVDLAVMFLVLGFFNHSLTNEERGLAPRSFIEKFKLERNYDFVVAAIFLVSIIPVFQVNVNLKLLIGENFFIPLRVLIWVAALVLGLARRVVLPLKKKGD